MKVIDRINADVWSDIPAEIANIRADSVKGEAVINLLNRIGLVIEIDDDMSEEALLEDDVRDALISSALRQCHVWCFGYSRYLILNQKQAEAVRAAARALAAVDGRLQCVIPLAGTTTIEIHQPYNDENPEDRHISVEMVDAGKRIGKTETYPTWDAFNAAYGLNQRDGA